MEFDIWYSYVFKYVISNTKIYLKKKIDIIRNFWIKLGILAWLNIFFIFLFIYWCMCCTCNRYQNYDVMEVQENSNRVFFVLLYSFQQTKLSFTGAVFERYFTRLKLIDASISPNISWQFKTKISSSAVGKKNWNSQILISVFFFLILCHVLTFSVRSVFFLMDLQADRREEGASPDSSKVLSPLIWRYHAPTSRPLFLMASARHMGLFTEDKGAQPVKKPPQPLNAHVRGPSIFPPLFTLYIYGLVHAA